MSLRHLNWTDLKLPDEPTADRLTIVSGAAISTPRVIELAGHLRPRFASIRSLLTRSAAEFVSPTLLTAATGEPPFVDTADLRLPHVRLPEDTDVTVVAPATADLMARAALGLADDLAATYLLMWRGPTLWAPATNPAMLRRATTRAHLRTLARRGGFVVASHRGRTLTGKAVDAGALAPLDEIAHAAAVLAGLRSRYRGVTVAVAGPAPVDPDDPLTLAATHLLHALALGGAALHRAGDTGWLEDAELATRPDLGDGADLTLRHDPAGIELRGPSAVLDIRRDGAHAAGRFEGRDFSFCAACQDADPPGLPESAALVAAASIALAAASEPARPPADDQEPPTPVLTTKEQT